MARLNEADLIKNIGIIKREFSNAPGASFEAVEASCEDIKKLFEITQYQDTRIGLPNLPFFVQNLDKVILSGDIGDYGACYFNLKDFTEINREYGQEEGTKIMSRFFLIFQEKLGDNGLVCSAGGDSGVVLFKLRELDTVLEHLHGQKIITSDGNTVWMEAVAGYNISLGNYANSGAIMNTLSPTMNIAKNVKHIPEVFFNTDLEKEVENAKRVLRLFPEAIKNDEFMVYYQPKVDLRGYTLAGAEALCRWVHGGKMIFPDEFIPVFENDGVAIKRLDFHMLDTVCKDIRRWMDKGLEPVQVSVNFSRCHLGNRNLLDEIVDIIDGNKVPRRFIQIELTETTTDGDFSDLKYLVAGLQIRGIATAIDDFGTGYSSLTLLKELPWKVLKIDKSFLREAASRGNNYEVILRHTISLCQELGIECIAEGVETSDNVRLLKENDCYMAQGYLFDKPLPVSAFEVRLKEKQETALKLFD